MHSKSSLLIGRPVLTSFDLEAMVQRWSDRSEHLRTERTAETRSRRYLCDRHHGNIVSIPICRAAGGLLSKAYADNLGTILLSKKALPVDVVRRAADVRCEIDVVASADCCSGAGQEVGQFGLGQSHA